jgi:hypothetical protein
MRAKASRLTLVKTVDPSQLGEVQYEMFLDGIEVAA